MAPLLDLLQQLSDYIIWIIAGVGAMLTGLFGYIKRIDSRTKKHNRALFGTKDDPNVAGIAHDVHHIKEEVDDIKEDMNEQHAEVYEELKDTQRGVYRLADALDETDELPFTELDD